MFAVCGNQETVREGKISKLTTTYSVYSQDNPLYVVLKILIALFPDSFLGIVADMKLCWLNALHQPYLVLHCGWLNPCF